MKKMSGSVSFRKKFRLFWELNQGPIDPDASSLPTNLDRSLYGLTLQRSRSILDHSTVTECSLNGELWIQVNHFISCFCFCFRQSLGHILQSSRYKWYWPTCMLSFGDKLNWSLSSFLIANMLFPTIKKKRSELRKNYCHKAGYKLVLL